jgi:GNAT superfamily N-acetyltransferase
MNIRLCHLDDEKNWIALNRDFMQFEIKEDSPWNDTEKTPDHVFQNTFREALENPKLITLLIIEEDKNPIGFANLMTIFSVWSHGKALIVDDLFIKAEYQGRGYGKAVMEYIEKYANKNGYKRIQFQSEPTNPDARKFYEALGFAASDMYFYVKYL